MAGRKGAMVRRLGLVLAACSIVAALVPPAVASESAVEGPVEDVLLLVDEALKCKVWADEPGGDPVSGSGGGRCNVGNIPVVVTVCLDYMGVTVPNSCTVKTGTGGASAVSKPVPCLPGLWLTQTTMSHIVGPETRVHSDPVLLTCLP